jgi:arginyl-tRNA synthetase
MMKTHIQQLISQAILVLQQTGTWQLDNLPQVQIERTRAKEHGDYACNIAMLLAKPLGQKPREIAEILVKALPTNEHISRIEIAGPGFINFFIQEAAQLAVIEKILRTGEDYGRSAIGAGKKVHIEFVSSNPTGPLHVGHGRGAAYGAVVADLLAAVGFAVHREYYVNDAGRQMDILATSVWLRYLELLGEQFAFPRNGYKGDYVKAIAAKLKEQVGSQLHKSAKAVFHEVPTDETEDGQGDKEAHIDALIANAKRLLGSVYRQVFDLGLHDILTDIREDLAGFGVVYQEWFSERSLKEQRAVEQCLTKLTEAGHTYSKEGALWFRSTSFGDDKDRVLVRENGEFTYFAADIAYHLTKFARGYDEVIDVWGADHHGYVPRVKAAVQALGCHAEQLKVLIVQFAVLYRGEERVQMSTRSGSFVTLRELREEVGNDACRFFYVMRKNEQHMDFDLELAKSQSSDNPVYYIQYAHARICSVLGQLAEKHLMFDETLGLAQLALLNESHEQALVSKLTRFPEVVETAALAYEPHQLAQYLRDLANDFHTYYNAHQFLVADANLRNARLCLVTATQYVLANGLKLLGVSAPRMM